MIGRNIASARPATIAEVEALLQAQKDGRELSFEQQTTLDYAKKVAKTSSKSAQSLVKELVKLEKLTPEVACKLVDLLPVNKEQLTAIVSKERYTLSEKEIEQVLSMLAKAASERPRYKPEEPSVDEVGLAVDVVSAAEAPEAASTELEKEAKNEKKEDEKEAKGEKKSKKKED
ncbi:MAG: RNA polymerase Rpb4 family protein [Candidatus Burarchaeum sp.]|nr:RNA polymerase Rpb4 family protein [Candidatus Burarchaeum sp.]MDO8339203.1 RNA polymerase Rpb4 family protein [Candidatus Burarchaeum sp.]